MQQHPAYEIFEHTADLGLRAWGKSRGDLFSNAARGLLSLITEPESVGTSRREAVKISEQVGLEELFRAWLAELLYRFHAEGFLVAEAEFSMLEDNALRARVRGEKYDRARHELRTEIKGITWHGLKIVRLPDGAYRAEVILDV